MYIAAKTSRERSGELFIAAVESLLDAGLSVRFRARGTSMSPAVHDGEHLIVAPIDASRVEVGDIVLCQMRRGPIAHRVCAIEARPDDSRTFTLYGDASLDSDLPVAAHQLRGQVVGVERKGKRLSLEIFGGVIGRTAFMIALGVRRSILDARTRLGARWAPAALPR